MGSDVNQPLNARKCFRKSFAGIDFSKLDDSRYESQQRVAFFRLKEYVDLAAKWRDRESLEDLKAILAAGDSLARVSTLVVDTIDRTARLDSIEGLMQRAKRSLATATASSGSY